MTATEQTQILSVQKSDVWDLETDRDSRYILPQTQMLAEWTVKRVHDQECCQVTGRTGHYLRTIAVYLA